MKGFLKLLIIVVVFVAIFYPVFSTSLIQWATSAGLANLAAGFIALGTYSAWALAAGAIGLAYVLAPEETGEIISSIADGAAAIIAAGTGAIIGGVTEGLGVSNVFTYALIGLGLYLFLSSDSDKKDKKAQKNESNLEGSATKSLPMVASVNEPQAVAP